MTSYVQLFDSTMNDTKRLRENGNWEALLKFAEENKQNSAGIEITPDELGKIVVQLLSGSSMADMDSESGRQVDIANMCNILKISTAEEHEKIKSDFANMIMNLFPEKLRTLGVSEADINDLGWRLARLKEGLGFE